MRYHTHKPSINCSIRPNLTNAPLNPPYLLPITATKFLNRPSKSSTNLLQAKSTTHPQISTHNSTSPSHPTKPKISIIQSTANTPPYQELPEDLSRDGLSRVVVLGAASLGLALLLMGIDGGPHAMAMGPGGPMMEDFWDNMRRYGLYVLTVSTGVAYTIFQPILELLKNPLSAILIITIFVGSIYLVSQVLTAMVGISEFSYDYGY